MLPGKCDRRDGNIYKASDNFTVQKTNFQDNITQH